MANTNTAALFLIQIHWLVAATDTDKISCSALSAINDEQCRHTNAEKALIQTTTALLNTFTIYIQEEQLQLMTTTSHSPRERHVDTNHNHGSKNNMFGCLFTNNDPTTAPMACMKHHIIVANMWDLATKQHDVGLLVSE